MHPSRFELGQFAAGSLDGGSFERIADHVESCLVCSDSIRELEASLQDSLIRELRGPQPQPEFEHESACRQLVEIVQSIGASAASPAQTSQFRSAGEARPKSLGPYLFIEVLGEGGMGIVYRVRHDKLDRDFALKLLPADNLGDQRSIDRFRREMRAIGKLHHPNIVQATDAGEEHGRYYLVMELVRGVDLGEISRGGIPLPTADASEIILQAATGLAHAHRNEMVHRDIKPSNLMLTRAVDGSAQVKVLDLGLALFHENDSGTQADLTATGQFMGTVEYMAPEQGTDSHDVDRRADIYSLGATLYKLLSGQPPFPADQHNSALKLMLAKAKGSAPSLATLRSDLPPDLVTLVDRMLARDPTERVQSAEEVASALAPFAEGHELERFLKPAVGMPAAPSQAHGTWNNGGQGVLEDTRTRAWSGTSTQSKPSRTPPQPSTEGRDRRTRTAVLAIAAAAFTLILLSTLFFISGESTIVVEIHDDQVEVTAAEGEIRITRGDQSGEEITIRPGEHTLHVSRGDLQFDTEAFQLHRGEKVSVSIGIVDGELRVLQDGELIGSANVPGIPSVSNNPATATGDGPGNASREDVARISAFPPRETETPAGPPSPATGAQRLGSPGAGTIVSPGASSDLSETENPDRRAAEWALQYGATVTLLTDTGRIVTIEGRPEELPDATFRLDSLSLSCDAFENDDEELRHLEGCTALRYLTLLQSDISELAFQRTISTLTGLEQFRQLYGSVINDNGLEQLAKLPRLDVLELQTDTVSPAGIRHLRKLSYLNSLHVRGVRTDRRIFREIAELSSLRRVDVTDVSLTGEDLRLLAQLPNLNSLGIQHFTSTRPMLLPKDLPLLEALQNIQSLRLEGPFVTDSWLEPVGKLSRLQGLDLSLSNVRGEGLRHLAPLSRLGVLSMPESELTDEGLEHIARMQSFDGTLAQIIIGATQVTDEGIRHLHGFGGQVDLRQTRVTAAGIAALRRSMPDGAVVESDFSEKEIEAAMAALGAEAP